MEIVTKAEDLSIPTRHTSTEVFTTVEPLITHTPRWMAELMGYEGLWPLGGVLKIDLKNLRNNYGNYECGEVISCWNSLWMVM